jgi:hypothetical protein
MLGATGAGAALDARLRGLKVACVEREDFACKFIYRFICKYVCICIYICT